MKAEEGDVITAELPGGGTGFGIVIDAVKEQLQAAPMAVTKYYVRETGTDTNGVPYITVASAKGGTAIVMNGDGGVTGGSGGIAGVDTLSAVQVCICLLTPMLPLLAALASSPVQPSPQM